MASEGILHVEQHEAAQRAERQPVFYYDLSSPESYIAAERIGAVLGVVPEWQPVLASALPAGEVGVFRCAEERLIHMAELERRAAELEMQPLRFPADWPTDSEHAMRVATYAKQIGRVVAFSLAAFRQAFAAGRDLSDPEGVVIAAAACEMHPNAVLKAAGMRSIANALRAATADAAARGVRSVPAVIGGGEVFHGDAGLEPAAGALAAGATR
ncbi:MAG TPA: DsbA family protein [Solirubrobacteraceae bacterium]